VLVNNLLCSADNLMDVFEPMSSESAEVAEHIHLLSSMAKKMRALSAMKKAD
jgi:hypothetical protein